MLFVLSPAKSLDYETPLPAGLSHTQPGFVEHSSELVGLLRQLSPQQIAELMDLSDALSSLNAARYFARSLKPAQLEWAQEHVCILSGLYGVLRPLDWMQPYRLEMGTALPNARGKNLYQFWGSRIADYLNERGRGHKKPVLVNLASEEYFKAVDLKALKLPVVQCVFEEFKGGKYKIISFMAKRARGLMVRYAIDRKADTPAKLEGFDLEGYAYVPQASEPERLVFRRRQSA